MWTVAGLIVAMLSVPLVAALVARASIPQAQTLQLSQATPSAVAPPNRAPAPAPEIQGRILDADGNPVAHAAVHVLSTGLPLSPLGEATSDEGGQFAFSDLPATHVCASRPTMTRAAP